MSRRALVLAVLIPLVLASWQGPVCPMAPESPAPEAGACHERSAPEPAQAGDCDIDCTSACQSSMTLPARVSAPAFLMPAQPAPPAPAAPALPLVAHAIDHIPLA